jgi:hypothetical protein
MSTALESSALGCACRRVAPAMRPRGRLLTTLFATATTDPARRAPATGDREAAPCQPHPSHVEGTDSLDRVHQDEEPMIASSPTPFSRRNACAAIRIRPPSSRKSPWRSRTINALSDIALSRFLQSLRERIAISGPREVEGPDERITPDGTALSPFPVNLCQPAGLKLGPRDNLILGCSVVFDTAGQALSPTDTNSAAPITLIVDAKSGAIVRTVAGISGSDEVWFNPGDERYYLAANADAVGPVLGVIDAENQTLTQLVPTSSKPPGAHSVAANAQNNHVLMPFGANNIFPGCLTGCVAVFGTSR